MHKDVSTGVLYEDRNVVSGKIPAVEGSIDSITSAFLSDNQSMLRSVDGEPVFVG